MAYLQSIDRYADALDNLLNQFEEATNLIALLEATFNRIKDSDDILDDLASKRDIETATGVWLDQLGDIKGIERPLDDYDQANIFTIGSADWANDPNKGIYDSVGGTGGYVQSASGLSDSSGSSMLDEPYRDLIKAKISADGEEGTIPDLYNYVFDAFDIETTITIPEIGQIRAEFDNSNGFLDDPSFDTGITEWADTSSSGNSVSWNASNKSLQFNRVGGSGYASAAYSWTGEIGRWYQVFIDVRSASASLEATLISGSTFLEIKTLSTTDTYVLMGKADDTAMYLDISLFVAGTREVNEVQVFPYITYIQRNTVEETAPNVAGTNYRFANWPNI